MKLGPVDSIDRQTQKQIFSDSGGSRRSGYVPLPKKNPQNKSKVFHWHTESTATTPTLTSLAPPLLEDPERKTHKVNAVAKSNSTSEGVSSLQPTHQAGDFWVYLKMAKTNNILNTWGRPCWISMVVCCEARKTHLLDLSRPHVYDGTPSVYPKKKKNGGKTVKDFSFILERARPILICKGHFHWKVFKFLGNLGKGTKAKTMGQQRPWPQCSPCNSRPDNCRDCLFLEWLHYSFCIPGCRGAIYGTEGCSYWINFLTWLHWPWWSPERPLAHSHPLQPCCKNKKWIT